MARLLLVDGHAYAYRAFFAIRNLTGPDGQPTNAIYGFIKMLSKMRGSVEPSHVAVVWDGGLSEQRTAALPEYKAQRPEMPDSLSHQIGEVHSYLEAAGVPSFQTEGIEADDMIASFARDAVQQAASVVIASSDKDFFQLVSPQVGILNAADKTAAVWGVEQVRTKTGVEPEQVVDWLSLIGDAVDNIPGVPGVGPKTAANLLRQFGSFEALCVRIEEVPSVRLREALKNACSVVKRNQSLVRLHSDVSGLPCWSDLVAGEPDCERLLALCTRWGFRSLATEIQTMKSAQGELFSGTTDRTSQESLDTIS